MWREGGGVVGRGEGGGGGGGFHTWALAGLGGSLSSSETHPSEAPGICPPHYSSSASFSACREREEESDEGEIERERESETERERKSVV